MSVRTSYPDLESKSLAFEKIRRTESIGLIKRMAQTIYSCQPNSRKRAPEVPERIPSTPVQNSDPSKDSITRDSPSTTVNTSGKARQPDRNSPSQAFSGYCNTLTTVNTSAQLFGGQISNGVQANRLTVYDSDINRNIPSQSPGFRTKNFSIGFNVPTGCRRLIELYRRLEQIADYLGPIKPGLNELIQEYALHRYQTFWLPMAAEHKLYAGAPLDVHAVWIAHLMDPLRYRQDCQRVAGRLVEHRLVSRRKLRQLTDRARGLWQMRYPKEPFDFDPNRTGYAELIEAERTKEQGRSCRVSAEVLNITRCQSHFFYQISLPHYTQLEFLEHAEHRYKQFLFIRKLQYQITQYVQSQSTDVKLKGRWLHSSEQQSGISEPLKVPENLPGQYVPMDIELAWRAHLVHPKSYARDTSCLYGKMLPHPCRPYGNAMLTYFGDIQSNTTALNHNSCASSKATDGGIVSFGELWKAYFPGSELHRSGSCDRGLSPRDQLVNLGAIDIYAIATKYTQISLNGVIARFDPNLEKFVVRIYHQQQQPNSQQSHHSSQNYHSRSPSIQDESSCRTPTNLSQHQPQENSVLIASSKMTPLHHHPRHHYRPGLTGECICKLHPPGRIWSATDETRPIAQFTVISGIHDQIAVDLIDRRGWLCPSNSLVGHGLLQLTSAIERFKGTGSIELEFICPLHTDECRGDDTKFTLRRKVFSCTKEQALSKSNCYSRDNKQSVTLLLGIAPPTRHALHLKVRVGPAFVCRLPPPSPKPKSAGYRIWGPVAHSPCPEQSEPSDSEQGVTCQMLVIKHSAEDLMSSFLTQVDEARSLVLFNKVLNHLGEHVLTVRVLHNISRGLSVVQVWSGNRLLSVGQLVGREQLPENRVGISLLTTSYPVKTVHNQEYSKKTKRSAFQKLRQRTNLMQFMTLKGRIAEVRSNKSSPVNGAPKEDSYSETSDSGPKDLDDPVRSKEHRAGCGLNKQQNERAILIKDARGDWCLVIGHWSGFKRFPGPQWSRNLTSEQDSGSTGTCTTRGYGGHLSLRIRWLSQPELKQSFAQVPDSVNSLTIVLRDAALNIQTGEIHISKQCNDVAQNVCLAFCCGLLHVLCQPRILTHEHGVKSLWDSGLSSDAALATSVRTQANHGNESTQEVDQEQPSSMTASTSFDSNNVIQLIENPLNNDRLRVHSNQKVEQSTPHKLSWNLISTIPKEWEPERKQLVEDGFSSYSFSPSPSSSMISNGQKEASSASSVEILGHVVVKELTVKLNELPSGESRPFSNNHSDGYMNYSRLSTCSLLFSTRGQINSLDYILCRASGIPVDTLIPSVQLARYVDRTKLLNTFFQNYPSDILFPQYETFEKSCFLSPTKSDQRQTSHKTIFRNASQTDPVQIYNSLRLKDLSPMKHPFLGWKLTDFYDYFLLELPDVCSGCMKGCQFCCGIGLL
ncbi:hypothetical protein D915_001852 [Fasciola hepatica]|uniref:Uncharacterized protein n=1 Tax=Fasciola hepatica TaxID=6192 RepID=A0A4E0RNS6_FASHE|nr:hypothetical protein D915_001852 [Fasciola hepatica]